MEKELEDWLFGHKIAIYNTPLMKPKNIVIITHFDVKYQVFRELNTNHLFKCFELAMITQLTIYFMKDDIMFRSYIYKWR